MDLDDFLSASYQFTLTNGQVSSVQWTVGPYSFSETPASNETFTVGGGMVTDSIAYSNAVETVVFAQNSANPANYQIATDTITVANPSTTLSDGSTLSYSFTVSNGAVTAMQESYGNGNFSFNQSLSLIPDATFTLNGNSVTETWVRGNAIETVTFVQSGGSGAYAVASETITSVPQGGAATQLDVHPFDRAQFGFDASGNVTAIARVDSAGTVTPLPLPGNAAFSQLAPGFVEETVTWWNGSSHYAVFYDASGSGTYTEVAHGSGTTVDLVGLKAQLAQLPSAQQMLV